MVRSLTSFTVVHSHMRYSPLSELRDCTLVHHCTIVTPPRGVNVCIWCLDNTWAHSNSEATRCRYYDDCEQRATFKSHSNAVRFFLSKTMVGVSHLSPQLTLERVVLHSRHMTGVCVILRGGGCNSSTVTTISFYCFLFVFPFISLNSLLFSLSLFLCISLLYFMHYVAFWLCLGRHNQARAKGTIRHAHSHFLFTIPFVFTWS